VGPDLTELSLVDAAAAVAGRRLSPVELTEAYLARIDAVEPTLNAYVTVTPERARADAARAEREIAADGCRGPLHGMPIGLKDLFDTEGVRTTAGSALHRERVPAADSVVAARLRAAGAVLLGKHGTHEFAWGGTCDNPHYGAVRNPYARDRIPGGSSGGSAASVVARTSLASVGTDTCGSVRIPAALSGCVGIKPTYGLVSMVGVIPLAPSLDHAGPLARTVADAATLLAALVDEPHAELDRLLAEGRLGGRRGGGSAGDVTGLRVGVLTGFFDEVLDPEVGAAVSAAVARLAGAGCDVVELRSPPVGPADLTFEIVHAEGGAYHRADVARAPESYSPGLRRLLQRPAPSASRLAEAWAELGRLVSWLRDCLARVDALVCATEPAPAPLIGAGRMTVGGVDLPVEAVLTRLTSIFNAARLPAVSVPCGMSAGGLPIGVQIVARSMGEATALRLADVAAVALPRPAAAVA
jgi:aspartyl-tRNA(Asn)/glutamyl-tRNA(Gln) amidotransferase subunit A